MNAYQSDALHEVENAILEDGNTYLSDKMHILRKYRRYYESDYKNVSILKPFLELLDIDIKINDSIKGFSKGYSEQIKKAVRILPNMYQEGFFVAKILKK